MKFKFTTTALVLAFTVAAPAAFAQTSSFDKDGNGTLNFAEFVSYERAHMMKKDVDKDGEYTLAEYANGGKKAKPAFIERMTTKFEKFDKDADGKLSKDEFKKSVKGKFKRKDANGDGELDGEEYKLKPVKKMKNKKN